MGTTNIEWATDTWNPVTGCTKVSEGCRNCYAERVVERFGARVHGTVPESIAVNAKARGLHGLPLAAPFTKVICHTGRLDQPLRWRKPRRVFVCSMGDLFHGAVSDEFIAAVFGVMAACPQHTFIVLTKRPNRMRGWFSWIASMGAETARMSDTDDGPIWTLQVAMQCARDYGSTVAECRVEWPLPNVWLGVSAENQATADERIPLLLQTPAARRFVSCEPMLGPVIFERSQLGQTSNCEECGPMVRVDEDGCCVSCGRDAMVYGVDWVICGGESGPAARPMHPDWARSLRDQCRAAEVPFFFKQWGEWIAETRPGTSVDLDTLESNEAVAYGDGKTNHTLYRRIGKKAAGRVLDGRTHGGFPEVRA